MFLIHTKVQQVHKLIEHVLLPIIDEGVGLVTSEKNVLFGALRSVQNRATARGIVNLKEKRLLTSPTRTR